MASAPSLRALSGLQAEPRWQRGGPVALPPSTEHTRQKLRPLSGKAMERNSAGFKARAAEKDGARGRRAGCELGGRQGRHRARGEAGQERQIGEVGRQGNFTGKGKVTKHTTVARWLCAHSAAARGGGQGQWAGERRGEGAGRPVLGVGSLERTGSTLLPQCRLAERLALYPRGRPEACRKASRGPEVGTLEGSAARPMRFPINNCPATGGQAKQGKRGGAGLRRPGSSPPHPFRYGRGRRPTPWPRCPCAGPARGCGAATYTSAHGRTQD